MQPIVHPLDERGTVALEVRALPDGRFGIGVRLPAGALRADRARPGILKRVGVEIDGRLAALHEAGDGMVTEKERARPGRLALTFGGTAIGAYDLADGRGRPAAPRLAVPVFAIKQAALDGSGRVSGGLRLAPGGAIAPRVDPHTHLRGAPSADALLSIAIERGVRYPVALLALAGIEAGGDADGLADLARLDPHALRRLARGMEVGAVDQLTFQEFERIYTLRRPLIRNERTLADVLGAIARDYAAGGVTYAELSTSDAVGAACFEPLLGIARRALPAIEEETGVRLRLLAACKRTALPALDDDIARIKRHAHDPLIAGVDLVGHEVGPDDAFLGRLGALMRWARDEGIRWQFRIHAGESPRHPGNVRMALETAASVGVPVRIGHGVYGCDDAAAELAARTGSTIEINATSNISLNNVHKPQAIPVRRWLDAGAPVVLGTDSTGVFLTSVAEEAMVMRGLGLGDADMSRIRAAADALADASRERERGLEAGKATALPPLPPLAPPPDLAPAPAAEAVRGAGVRVAAAGAPFDAAGLAGRAPLLLSGSTVGRFPERDRDVSDFLESLVGGVLAAVDPFRTLVVVDGAGSEAERVACARARAVGIPVLMTVGRDSDPEAVRRLAPTHAVLLDGGFSERICQLIGPLLRAPVRAAVYLGGGSVAADEIRALLNAGIDPVLVRGLGGASSWLGKVTPALAAFDADGVCRALRYRGFPLLPGAPW